MNCTICGRPVVLNPSAQERAEKYGGTAQDYIKLFPQHAQCILNKRNKDTAALIKRINNKE